VAGAISIDVAVRELARRRRSLRAPQRDVLSGALEKYAALVGSAFRGAVTHRGAVQRNPSVSRDKRAPKRRSRIFRRT